MDLARYVVEAVVVEGRGIRAVARVARGLEIVGLRTRRPLPGGWRGGHPAQVDVSAPLAPAYRGGARGRDLWRAQASLRARPRRRSPDHRLAPRTPRTPGPRRVDHRPGPQPPWVRHPPAEEAAPQFLRALRGAPPERVLAVRHHPLALGERRRSASSTSSTTTPGSVSPRSPVPTRWRPTWSPPSTLLARPGGIPPPCSPTTARSTTRDHASARPCSGRARSLGHRLQALSPLPSPDLRKGRALPPDAEEVLGEAAQGANRRWPQPRSTDSSCTTTPLAHIGRESG